MRADIGRFDRFRSGKQLAHYCGLSPKNASSGKKQADGGLVREANAPLRTVLIEAGWRLIRYSSVEKTRYEHLRDQGKPANVALAATMNRWIRRIYHDMKPLGLAA